ncbi:iduronate 2-sulfatase-like isoform X1 [Gordionus sp. m RMFG-2023]|uniref:iduronate 2-sulfatase-like isoform X1 n=2 Tax=Gordionus sp. m RMFG-2023 TaxID=3053472 RepID=UPI0031FDBEDD
MADDMRPDLGCYGNEQVHTPNLDYLASRGILFRNAYSQQALCAPSRASIFTSRLPERTKVFDLHTYWRVSSEGNFTTMPQYFKENGYFTYSIGKVFHPGKASNFSDDYPYSWSLPPYHPPSEIYENKPTCSDYNLEENITKNDFFEINSTNHLKRNAICPVDVHTQPTKTLPDIEMAKHAIKILSKISKSRKSPENNMYKKPFFLAVGFHKPHLPLKYPKNYKRYYPLDKIILPSNPYYPANLPEVAWNPWLSLQSRDDIKRLNISFPFGYLPNDVQYSIPTLSKRVFSE